MRQQDTCPEGADQASEFRGKEGLGAWENREDSIAKSLTGRKRESTSQVGGEGAC